MFRRFKTNRDKDVTHKSDEIISFLQKEKNLKNVKQIAEQFLGNEPIIEYNYKDDVLFIINEEASLYHIVHSTIKLEKLANAVSANENEIMMDIGANVGLFSYFYKKKFPKTKAYLFEPDKKLLPVIEKNLNKFGEYWIVNAAITDFDGEIDFFRNPKSSQTNSTELVALLPFIEPGGFVSEKVVCQSLLSFCLGNKIEKIDTLKIDIQGGEYKALRHSEEVLKFTKEILIEICFLMPDTVPLITLMDKYFKNSEPINDIIMGADIKFFQGI